MNRLLKATAAGAVVAVCGAGPARADFEQPFAQCPGALERREGTPANPGGFIALVIPADTTVTCEGVSGTTLTNTGAGEVEIFAFDLESIGATLGGDFANIAHSGTLQVTGPESIALGIEGNFAEIVNNGTLEAEGTESVAAGIEGDHGTITNNALTTVTASGTEASGLFIEGNHGTIDNKSTVTADGQFSSGASIEGDNATLTNNGTIEINGETSGALAAGGNDAKLTNNGTITTTGSNAFGVGVIGSGATVTNKMDATIETTGSGAHGLILGLENADELSGGIIPPGLALPSQGTVTNDGTITTFGVAMAPAQGEAEPAGADGIHAFADNATITNTGEIMTLGRNSDAVDAIGDGNTIKQEGVVETSHANSVGLSVTGSGATILNGAEGVVDDAITVTTSGDKSHGIALGRQSQDGEAPRSSGTVKNFGKIATSGSEADGIHGFADDGAIVNRNEIATTGDRAAGVNQFGDRVDIRNLGTIETEAEKAPGIRGRGQDLTIVNGAPAGETGEDAKIATTGDGAHGVLVAPESGSELNPNLIVPSQADVTNHSAIETVGDEAHGVLAFVTDSKIENTGDITVSGKDSIAVSVRGGDNEFANDGALDAGTLEQAQMEAEQPPGPNGPPEGRVGVNFIDKTSLENSADGSIGAFGENAAGVRGRDAENSSVANDGTILAFGKNARGVDIEGDKLRVENGRASLPPAEALIAAEGEKAVGVRTLGAGAFVSNRVTETEEGIETVGISVAGEKASGIDATATASGAFLVENAGKMEVQGANAVGMALRNGTDGALAFSSPSGSSDCLGSPMGAGLANCGSLEVSGDDSVGLLAQGLNDSTIENFGTIEVTGDRAVAIKLEDGANGAGADNNLILNITDATATGSEAKGVSIKGDANVLVQGNSEIILPVDATTFSVISQFIDVTTAAGSDGMETGKQDFPLGDIRASGADAVGVSVEGDNNVVGISMGLSDFDPTGETPGLPTAPKISSVIAEGAGSIGVELSGDSNILANFGIVSGEAKAVQGGAGKETVIGAGIFIGNIDLAGGDDEFNLGVGMNEEVFLGNSNPSLAGIVDGGAGLDKFRLIDSKFFGGGKDPETGEDLVSSGVEDFPEEFFRFGTVDGDRVLNFETFIVDITDQNVDLENTLTVDTAEIENGTLRLDQARLEAEQIDIRDGGFLTGNGTITALPNDIGLINLSEIVVESGAGVMPGDSPGTLEFIGNTLFAGFLEIEIAGLGDGQFDRLIVDGDLTFDEALIQFVFLDGFLPEEGDVFEFLDISGALLGFDTLSFDFLGLPGGFDFDVSMMPLAGGFGLGLMATSTGPFDVPEPATLALFALGIAGLIRLRRRERSLESVSRQS